MKAAALFRSIDPLRRPASSLRRRRAEGSLVIGLLVVGFLLACPGESRAQHYITGKTNPAKCLHKQSGGWANGNAIHVWDCDAGPDENKTWTYDPDTGYIRGEANPAKCLHKRDGGWANGNPIHVWDCNAGGAENKTWTYDPNTGYIQGAQNPAKCLHKRDGGWNNGNPIHVWDCNAGGAENKTWSLKAAGPTPPTVDPPPPGESLAPQYITGTKLNKCFQKQHPGWANGNAIHLWDCDEGTDENKTWTYDPNTGYIQGAENPAKCLHKRDGGWANGNAIHVWDCNAGGAENKTWTYDANTGYIQGRENPAKCLVKKFGSWTDGNPIHVWDCNDVSAENKTWRLRAPGPAPPLVDTAPDRQALMTLYNATDGRNWRNNTNWGTDAPVSTWYGVTVEGDRVARIRLPDHGLSGSIPAELGQLSHLEMLLLEGNQLSGSIPAELGRLSNLTILDLSGNQLSGSIPAELGGLSNLTILDLSANQFTGPIPAELGGLSQLEGLSLSNNQFTGPIPFRKRDFPGLHVGDVKDNPGLCQLQGQGWGIRDCQTAETNMVTDSLALVILFETTRGNQWDVSSDWNTGPVAKRSGITVSDGRVTSILMLDSKMTGPIPVELGQLSELKELWLENNSLSGSIPAELGRLSKLESLVLIRGRLSGPIPGAALSEMSQLTYLDLSANQFTGPIPAELGGLSQLERLSLGNNQLSGPIPAELGGLSQLKGLSLSNNQFTGPIPAELGGLSQLEALWLSNNQFTGPIPAELGGLSQLTHLGLGANRLRGPIPFRKRDFPGLSVGNVKDNPGLCQLQGQGWGIRDCQTAETNMVTDSLALMALYNATDGRNWRNNTNWGTDAPVSTWYGVTVEGDRVARIRLPGDGLSGSIPAELGGLHDLKELHLAENQLTGAVPAGLGGLRSLQKLYLYKNQFSGSIPAQLGQLSSLQELLLDANKLTGSIPVELGRLSNLKNLDLDDNQLSGSIPAALGQLQGLTLLGLANNQLSGSIPAALGQLRSLEGLFLDGNTQLTGTLPDELVNLTALKDFKFDEKSFCRPWNVNLQAWLEKVYPVQGTWAVCADDYVSLPPAVLGTDETADRIETESTYWSDELKTNNQVMVCLVVQIEGTDDGWWKGLAFSSERPVVATRQKEGDRCAVLAAQSYTLTFWKDKGGLVRGQAVGSKHIDLKTLAGWRVVFTWVKD